MLSRQPDGGSVVESLPGFRQRHQLASGLHLADESNEYDLWGKDIAFIGT